MVVLLRFQIAVVYMFASIWKMTPDWWNGYCVQSIFLSFEDQGVARGVPWRYLLDRFPWIFMLVAFGGVFLDSLMFISLTFFRPSKAGENAHRSTMPPAHHAEAQGCCRGPRAVILSVSSRVSTLCSFYADVHAFNNHHSMTSSPPGNGTIHYWGESTVHTRFTLLDAAPPGNWQMVLTSTMPFRPSSSHAKSERSRLLSGWQCAPLRRCICSF